MTVGELKSMLNEVPDNAEVFIWADRGQDYEHPSSISYSKGEEVDDGDAMIWQRDETTKADLEKYYDEETLDNYDFDGEITAICIEY